MAGVDEPPIVDLSRLFPEISNFSPSKRQRRQNTCTWRAVAEVSVAAGCTFRCICMENVKSMIRSVGELDRRMAGIDKSSAQLE